MPQKRKEKAMKQRSVRDWVLFVAVVGLSAALTVAALTTAASAADLSVDSLKFAAGVAKAPGYEPIADKYIVANPTSVYSDHSFFDTKVTGELKRGDHVEALAKVKGYDWVLVGKNGTGIGYVAISMLSPENKYVP
jgi:hypothetical protein